MALGICPLCGSAFEFDPEDFPMVAFKCGKAVPLCERCTEAVRELAREWPR